MKRTFAVTSAVAVVSTAVSAIVNFVKFLIYLYSCLEKGFYLMARYRRVDSPKTPREK